MKKVLSQLIIVSALTISFVSCNFESATEEGSEDANTVSRAVSAADISGNLPDGYEPSDCVWHTRLNKLFLVSDEGIVSSMNYDGTNVQNWEIGGDLEGICVADPQSNFIYVGEEEADYIHEFNISTGEVTRSFDVDSWIGNGDGLEALTFVPDSSAEGGLFYAGDQSDGEIYIFRCPIKTSTSSTSVTNVGVIDPISGREDISGLHYDSSNGVLYGIWDSYSTIAALETDGTIIEEWELPGENMEGLAIWHNTSLGTDQLFVAEDSGSVKRYALNDVIDEGSGGNTYLSQTFDSLPTVVTSIGSSAANGTWYFAKNSSGKRHISSYRISTTNGGSFKLTTLAGRNTIDTYIRFKDASAVSTLTFDVRSSSGSTVTAIKKIEVMNDAGTSVVSTILGQTTISGSAFGTIETSTLGTSSGWVHIQFYSSTGAASTDNIYIDNLTIAD